MINYTERIALLMQDVVSRTPALTFIDLREVLVFARFGRAEAEGAFATCHCLTLPETEPGYYFWKDRVTGELTRRSEWFVTKTPEVRVGHTRIKYLISFVLPRSNRRATTVGLPETVGNMLTGKEFVCDLTFEGRTRRRRNWPVLEQSSRVCSCEFA